MDSNWIVSEKILIGVSQSELFETEVFIGQPYISKNTKKCTSWKCHFKIVSELIKVEGANEQYSSFTALLGAIANVRHAFSLKIELEGFQLFKHMQDVNQIEAVTLESVFYVEDCIPEDYQYVIATAKSKGISLE